MFPKVQLNMKSTRSMKSNKLLNLGYLVLGACCAILFVAVATEAQYNTYDSDSNLDSEGSPIWTNAELGKLVRGLGQGRSGAQLRNLHDQQQLAASRNLYNRQQLLQHEPSQYSRRQYGDDSSSYSPTGLSHEASSSNEGDDEGPNFGPNFGSNYDAGDQSGAGRGASMSLKQAASGYPESGDYSGEQAAGFGPSYGPSEGNEFGPSDSYGNEARRAKSASSLMGARNMGDDDAGALQLSPNSAINAGDADDESRASYSPEASSAVQDNEDDDE